MNEEPKPRTIRAYAVVCVGAKVLVHNAHPERGTSDAWREYYDSRGYGCGPHTVVELTGIWTPKKGKAKR